MKLFTTTQIRMLDKYTIEHEPVSSVSLMERAANRILTQFKKDIRIGSDILILAGPGNNGGDGLALGRMLLQVGYDVEIMLVNTGKLSPECKLNKERLIEYFPDSLTEISHSFSSIELSEKAVIVDAVFGSGLSRPLTGIFREVVEWINNSGRKIISIDIPTGLNGEACAKKDDTIVRADLTYSLQFPKLSFFFAENEEYIGEWKVIDIQLHPHAIDKTETNYFYIEKEDIRPLVQPRSRFSHKGTFGHVLIWAGKKGMAGAAVLASKGALRAGAGLVSVHSVEENRQILQTAVPEAIFLNEIQKLESYHSFAFGPGIGTSNEASEILVQLLESIQSPCILDADALNIISENKRFLSLIPTNSILTPHPKEFERLFGTSANSPDRLQKARQNAVEYKITLVLKGAFTAICTPNGNVYFNSTGNPGMAIGGMGDVLTGTIAGLLAQGYSPEESAKLGVYLHGSAGDLALKEQSYESLLPSDLLKNIGYAYMSLK